MLIIAEEKDNYPPNGQIPNLETDEKACVDILTRIAPLMPDSLRAEVVGALINWSESVLKPDQSFGTWAEAVAAATSYAQRDTGRVTDSSQGPRGQATDGVDLVKLNTALGSTGKTDDPQIALRDESRRWANCGIAAFQIREQLRAAGGKPARLSHDTYGAGGGDALKEALLATPASAATVLLLDCQFPQVHNFIIEVHHDGSRYLAQGYQGTYYAHWWLGINDSYSAEEVPSDISDLRERYGLGRAISSEDYATLLDGLVVAISSDWQATADQWPALPFNPDRQEIDGIRRRSGSPTLIVEVFELGEPGVARKALGDKGIASLSELATRGMATA